MISNDQKAMIVSRSRASLIEAGSFKQAHSPRAFTNQWWK